MNYNIKTGWINSDIKYTTQKNNKTNTEFSVARFTLSVYRYYSKEQNKNVYNIFLCEAIGKMANNIAKNFIKGQKVLVQGKDEIDKYMDTKEKRTKYIQRIRIEHIEFMGNTKNEMMCNDEKEDPKNLEDTLNDEEMNNDFTKYQNDDQVTYT